MNPIRVFIVDDSAVVRQTLTFGPLLVRRRKSDAPNSEN